MERLENADEKMRFQACRLQERAGVHEILICAEKVEGWKMRIEAERADGTSVSVNQLTEKQPLACLANGGKQRWFY